MENFYNIALVAVSGLSALAVFFSTRKSRVVELLITEKEAWKESSLRKEDDRKESDGKHEKVLAEYRTLLTGVREKLQATETAKASVQMELVALQGRTDFVPVLEFQQAWHAEQKLVHEQILATLQVIGPILQETSNVLKQFGKGTQDVKVVNPVGDPAIVKVAEK